MSALVKDLFPETLLVSCDGTRIYTTSRKVAAYFHKRHDNVFRDTEKLIAELADSDFSLLNFEESKYIDERGKSRSEYRLTHDGFALLAMGFTGREALVWKIKFLEAFNAMEAELQAVTARYAAALDQLHPSLRPVVDGTQQGKKRIAIAAPLGKSCAAVTYHRGKARRLGLLPVKGGAL